MAESDHDQVTDVARGVRVWDRVDAGGRAGADRYGAAAMSGGEIFGYGWREDHARAGDEALEAAVRALGYGADQGKSEAPMSVVMAAMANSQALAAIAQAHYAAANICARPIRDVELP